MPDHDLIRCISREGAYGEVWLARNVMGTYRAVKIVRRDRFKADGPYNTEFEGLRIFHDISREHHGFVDILQVTRNDQERYFCYVMELADALVGGVPAHDPQRIDPATYQPATLKTVLDRRGALRSSECVDFALDISEALIDLHKRKLVHRDLKPSNIILIKGRARIGDIGLVGEVIGGQLPMIGTPGYMDPELHGTFEGDLYSLGKIIYVMATGKAADEWPVWPARRADLPIDVAGLRELNEVFARACHVDRARRYRTAEDLRADLLVVKSGRSLRRLIKLDKLTNAFKRYGSTALAVLTLGGVALWQNAQRRKHADEVLQGKVSAAVESGRRALEKGELVRSLPSFAEAFRLDADHPEREHTHRVRIGSVLRHAPELVRMWFGSPQHPWAECSADGTQLLFCGTNGSWQVWDIASGQPRSAGFHQGATREYAHLSPDGRHAIIRSEEPEKFPPKLWNLASGQPVWALPLSRSNSISDVAFSPDGTQVIFTGATDRASGGSEGLIVLCDARTGERLFTRKYGTNQIMSVAFSPDGRRVVTGDSGGGLSFWTNQNQRLDQTPHVVRAHSSWIYNLTFSRDGQRIATASADRTARIWNATNGEAMGPPLLHADVVFAAQFSRDSRWLVTAGGDYAAHIWEIATGQRRLVLPHNSKVERAEFGRDNQQVMTVASDGVIRLWNLRLDDAVLAPQPVIASADGLCLARFFNDRVEVLNSQRDQTLGALALPNVTAANAWLSDDGVRLVIRELSGSTTTRIRLSYRNRSAPDGPAISLNSALANVVVTRTAGRLAAFGGTNAALVDLESGRVTNLVSPTGRRIRCATFDPAGRHLALAMGSVLQLFDASTGKPIGGPCGHPMGIEYIEFSRDGRFVLATCRDQSIDPGGAYVWEVATGRRVSPPLMHRDGVVSAAFDNTGHQVVTCGEDRDAWIWDIRSGRPQTPPLQHDEQVLCAAWSPDDRWIATGCRDGTVRLWNVLAGDLLTLPWRLPDAVSRVQFFGPNRLFAQTKPSSRAPLGESFLIDLPVDSRPLTELEMTAQLLSGQGLPSASKGAVTLTRDHLETLWREWQGQHANVVVNPLNP